jgi:HlyD family secretion protein
MKFKKTMVTAVLLLAAAGAGYAYWRMGNGPKEPPYLTTPVAKANIRQVVSSTGTLQAVTTVLVGSQVSGTIAKLNVDFNSKVIKGQIVAELDQARFAARVEETRANVLAAQASFAKSKVALEDAERTLKRVKELKQRELVSQSELDAAQTAYDSARSQVNVTQAQVGQAQASMNQAQIDLGYTIIRSPVDGIVISRAWAA